MNNLHPKNILNIILVLFTMTGCNKAKTEFISLDHMTFTNSYYKDSVKISYYVLIDHPASEDKILKTEIIQFVKNKLKNNQALKKANTASLNFVFYRKTDNTSYFIKNKEDSGGLASEEISHYKDEYIANYYLSKCNGGTLQKIYMYDLPEEVIINNCK